MERWYARSLRGERARGKKPNKRGKNVSLLSALSLEKLVASTQISGSVDGTTFEAFISQQLVPNLWENACVVMDNAKFHQGEMVRELIEQAGAKLIYLPPYSPEFSPIENFWCGRHCRIPAGIQFQLGRQSKVKAILRKLKPRTYKDLVNGITEAMLKVTNQDIRNWFTHCCYCTS
jgi:transposase